MGKRDNRVRNSGFESSNPPDLAPHWTGTGATVTGGVQLDQRISAELASGQFISQILLTLEKGKTYVFTAAFATFGSSGTIAVRINGGDIHNFQANNMPNQYADFSFAFKAGKTNSFLTITNNTDGIVRIDNVSILLQ